MKFQFLIVFCITLLNSGLTSCNSAQKVNTEIAITKTESVKPIEKIETSWVYINKNIKWESPPKEIEQTFQGSLNSNIVVFYPSGKFAFVGCTLYRDNKTKNMSLSNGDDFSVSKGNWKQNGDGTITVVSHLTHSALENSLEKIETWKIKEQSSERLAKSLEIDGEIYVPIQKLGNFDQIAPMIADENLPRNKVKNN